MGTEETAKQRSVEKNGRERERERKWARSRCGRFRGVKLSLVKFQNKQKWSPSRALYPRRLTWKRIQKREQARKSNVSALRIRESNPRTWRPFNPASIIGMSRIRGCLQERAPSQPPTGNHRRREGGGNGRGWVAGRRGARKGGGGGGGFPCFLAATHYFLVVAFDVDGPGHSKRLIENFLRLENGARNAIGGRVARYFTRRSFIPASSRHRERGIHLFNM